MGTRMGMGWGQDVGWGGMGTSIMRTTWVCVHSVKTGWDEDTFTRIGWGWGRLTSSSCQSLISTRHIARFLRFQLQVITRILSIIPPCSRSLHSWTFLMLSTTGWWIISPVTHTEVRWLDFLTVSDLGQHRTGLSDWPGVVCRQLRFRSEGCDPRKRTL